jgi:hypothetical protein
VVLAVIGWALGAAVLVGFFVLQRYYRRESKKISDEGRTWWWERRKKDRDDLLSTARTVISQGGFRAQRADESPWSYAKAFDVWSAKQLNINPTAQWGKPYEQTDTPLQLPRLPRMPRMPRMPRVPRTVLARGKREFPDGNETFSFTWTSMQTFWWTTERDGLVHRVVALKHDGAETFVLRCDHDERVVPQLVDQHLDGEGPVLTCIRCFSMPRTK